jgi:hypothetical protein
MSGRITALVRAGARVGTFLAACLRAALGAMRQADRGARAFVRFVRDPAGRDKIAAGATFALIFGCTLASVDFLITGGLDWSPGAQPAPVVIRVEHVAAATSLPADFAAPPPPPAALALEDVAFGLAVGDLLGAPDIELASAPSAKPAALLYTAAPAPAVAAAAKPSLTPS